MTYIRPVLQSGYRAIILTLILVLSTTLLLAQGMSSGTYRIESDSVNVGGGYSTSSSYRQESTAGEVATGDSSSSNYELRAGYQQMQEVFLSLSAIADVDMAPSLGGLTGGTATGSASFLVTTDSPAGYTVYYAAANTPAMQSGSNSIANYAPVGAVPDYTFTITSSEAQFGFSPEGPDIVARFKDNGSVCGIGSSDASNSCWEGVSTTPQTIVRGVGSNHPDGATTTLRFQVGVGAVAGVPVGSYVATTTITALPL